MVQIQDNLDYEIILLLLRDERHIRDISKALDAFAFYGFEET